MRIRQQKYARSAAATRWRVGGTVAAALLLASVFIPGTAASATARPPLETPVAALDAALSCPSSFTHTDHEPVLLVHGTAVDADQNWSWNYLPALRNMGYDVCTVNLPEKSMGDIQAASEYVVHAIDVINSGAGRKVDVIGHSQGNLETRWALKYWPDLQNKVDDFVSLGAPDHGLAGGNFFCALPCAAADFQMSIGSDFTAALNTVDETPGSVSYTSVYSHDDTVATPWTTSVKSGATNIAVQDVCFGRVVSHVGLLYDSVTFQLAVDALSHSGTANAGRLPFGKCLGSFLPGLSAADVATNGAAVDASASATLLAAPVIWTEPLLKAYAQG